MKTNKTIHSKKQKYNTALAMAVLMTLGGFSFGANPIFAETTDKLVFIKNNNGYIDLQKDISIKNFAASDYLVKMYGSNVQIKNLNVTDSSINNSSNAKFTIAVDVTQSNVALGEALNISDISLSTNDIRYDNCGLRVLSSTLEAPTININGVTGNSGAATVGMNAESFSNDAVIKANDIIINDIKSDKTKIVEGLASKNASWKCLDENQTNNLTITNITSGVNEGIACGFELSFIEGDRKNFCTIKGNTVIKNITSNGSALGIVTPEYVEIEDASANFHNLNISDIRGKDLSAGIVNIAGDINADNAIIDITGKNGYDGLYADSKLANNKTTINSFATFGTVIGSVNLDNVDGNYKINGNILADRMNVGVISKIWLDFYENPKNKDLLQGWSDEEIAAEIHKYQEMLKRGSTNLGGHLELYGDVYAKNSGVVNINLTNGSVFEGQADNYTDYDTAGKLVWRKADLDSINNSAYFKQSLPVNKYLQNAHKEYGIPLLTAGKIDISMEDGSQWKAHGKSFVDTLNFKDGGLVDMRAEDGSSVTAGKVTGKGTFIMNLSNNAAKSDMLYVKDISEAGVQTIQANLKDGLKPEDLKGMRFATTGGDDYKRDPNEKFKVVLYKNQGVNDVTYKVSNEAFNVKNEKFDPEATETNEKFNGGKDGAGTYKPGNDYITAIFSGKKYNVPDYEKILLAQADEKTIFDEYGNLLPEYMKEEVSENPIKEGTNWYLDTAVNNTSNSGKIIKNAAALDYANAVTTDTLNKRLGEARYSNEGDGMWARVRHDRFGKTNRYEGKNTMTELGYDWKRCDTSYGKHMQGAAVNYTTDSADYKGVTGESSTKRYGLSFYDTQLRETGHYLDAVAKFGRVSNKFTLEQEDANNVNADYHNNYYALSFEYGRKNALENSWYVEPQAQLQYTYLASTDYRTSQGTDVQLSGTDSLIGRVGFRIGRELDDKTTFYFDANAYHEFLGDQDILAIDKTGIMNATTHNDGTWYEAGVGISGKLNKNTNGFVQFTKGFGSDVEHTWSFEGGLNFTF